LAAFLLIAFLALIGTIFTWAGKPLHSLNCVLTWFFIPLLLILITIAWIVLGFISMGAVMVGGKCNWTMKHFVVVVLLSPQVSFVHTFRGFIY
jgi:hypothetical protein